MTTRILLSAFFTVLTAFTFGQCYSDACIDSPSQTTSVPGCCIGTTVGATNSITGTYNGCPFTGGQDVWMTFVAPANGYLQIDFTAITIAGNVSMIVFDSFSNADNCSTLNAGGIIAATECFNAATPPNPINLNYVQAGERYFILISSPPGSTPGSWEICLSITLPIGGMDCGDATVLCDKSTQVVADITAGGGAVSGDNTLEDLSTDAAGPDQGITGSCWGNGPGDGGGEVNSQWYTFTCGQSGTLTMAVMPNNTTVNCAGPSVTGDDYDFMLLDITTTTGNFFTCNIQQNGIADSATVLQCDWSAQPGVTGFAAAGPNSMGFFGTGQGGCQSTDDFVGTTTAAFNNFDVNIVCGRTYALVLSNYTGASTAGFTLSWGGTGLLGVQPVTMTVPLAGSCSASATITAPLCGGSLIPNYTYEVNWGDGTTSTVSSTNISHAYASSGTYNITVIVTDPVGCTQGTSQPVDVICTLPVELTEFSGIEFGTVNKLYWRTATEKNSDYFVVEKSEDNGTWAFLDKIDAAGHSSSSRYYSIDDARPAKFTYYRLKQFDYNGASETFAPIYIERDKTEEYIFSPAAPNPSNGTFSIAYTGNDLNKPVIVSVVSNDGRTCYQEIFDVQKSKLIELNNLNLRPGNYLLKLAQDDRVEIQRITIN